MTDLGLHGFPATENASNWIEQAHSVLDELPDVFSTVWMSDRLQIDGEPAPDAWTRLTWLGATFLDVLGEGPLGSNDTGRTGLASRGRP